MLKKYTVNVKGNDGKVYPVECTLNEHPTKYGNGTCVLMEGECLAWGQSLLDTRYISFDDFGGFKGFCEEQLRSKGYEIARQRERQRND